MDVIEHDLGLEAFGVGLESLHQLRALDTVHVGGPVVHVGGGHELATLGNPGDEHRIQVGPCRIHCSGVARGAGT